MGAAQFSRAALKSFGCKEVDGSGFQVLFPEPDEETAIQMIEIIMFLFRTELAWLARSAGRYPRGLRASAPLATQFKMNTDGAASEGGYGMF